MSVEIPMQIIWGLVGYILVTTGMAIYWAAVMTTKLDIGLSQLKELMSMNHLYALKTDVAGELAIQERRLDTLGEKFDKLKEKVDGCQNANNNGGKHG